MPRQADARGTVVVIPAWNAAETIGAQLAALATQDFAGDWRVVVVDDGSTDDTSSVVEQSAASFPVELTLVRHDSCRGASAARNTGVLASTEPLILLCDADDVVAPGWITALVAALADADGAGGRLELERLNLEHHRQWALGAEGLTRSWLQVHEWGMPSPLTGCCGVTREAWASVGGFNERLGRGEDTDFFWRLQCQGYRLADAPDAVVHYRLAPNPRVQLRKLITDGRANTTLLWAFHHPKRRRQLLLEVAGAVRRSPRTIRRATRPQAVYDLVWAAGRLVGVSSWIKRRHLGPDVRPRADV